MSILQSAHTLSAWLIQFARLMYRLTAAASIRWILWVEKHSVSMLVLHMKQTAETNIYLTRVLTRCMFLFAIWHIIHLDITGFCVNIE